MLCCWLPKTERKPWLGDDPEGRRERERRITIKQQQETFDSFILQYTVYISDMIM
jgi:hypothetical protein